MPASISVTVRSQRQCTLWGSGRPDRHSTTRRRGAPAQPSHTRKVSNVSLRLRARGLLSPLVVQLYPGSGRIRPLFTFLLYL